MSEIDLDDLRYLSFAEWISGDYNDFVKKSVLPVFSKRYSLKLRETRVLNAIASADRYCTASHISDVLRQDPATVTRSLVMLIGKEFIISEEDFNDGRSRILKPTQKGNEASAYFLSVFSDIIDKAAHTSNRVKFNHDHSLLTQSLEMVANRARAFRESQHMLSRMLNPRTPPAFNYDCRDESS